MPKVTTIPPRKQRNHAVTSQETRKIRVAAYCRVSTDTEEHPAVFKIVNQPMWKTLIQPETLMGDDGSRLFNALRKSGSLTS